MITPIQLGPTMRMPCPSAKVTQFLFVGSPLRACFSEAIRNDNQRMHSLMPAFVRHTGYDFGRDGDNSHIDFAGDIPHRAEHLSDINESTPGLTGYLPPGKPGL